MKASNKQTLLKAASESTADKISSGDQYSQAQSGLTRQFVSRIDGMYESERWEIFVQGTI